MAVPPVIASIKRHLTHRRNGTLPLQIIGPMLD
jgi:hypothetical protein